MSTSQSSFRRTFRSPRARKWRANCDTLWTAATGIKSRRGRRFVDVRGNIRVCRSSRRRANTRRATSTGTSSGKHLWREQRDVWPSERAEWWISSRSLLRRCLACEFRRVEPVNFKYARNEEPRREAGSRLKFIGKCKKRTIVVGLSRRNRARPLPSPSARSNAIRRYVLYLQPLKDSAAERRRLL